MAGLSGIHHVSLSVRELDRSATWYATVLGFEELLREDGAERRACVMRFPAGGYSVGLVEHRSTGDATFDPTRPGLDHLASAIEVPPGASLNFTDPDGIALALFWDRPPG